MHGLSAKSLPQQSQQMRIANLAIVRTESWAGALALNLDAAQRRATEVTVVTR